MTDMNIDIAEKLGWRKTDTWDVWFIPETAKLHLPNFTSSLDACVKYIVPDMNNKGFKLMLCQNPNGTWDAIWSSDHKVFMGTDKDPEQAICKAFMEVLSPAI